MNTNFDCVVRVYDKKMQLLAVFDGNTDGYTESEMRNMMVAPTVHIETNGESSLTFQMLVKSEKWNLIKDPENIYVLNGRYYTALNEDSYRYAGEDAVRTVTVTLVERWYLLAKQYNMAYNCGLYTYAKATFQNYTTDGAFFKIQSDGCSVPGGAVTNANAWKQVKLWEAKDKDGNQLTYTILKSKEYEPTKWEDAPSAVQFTSFSVSGNTATVTLKSATKTTVQQNFEYTGDNSFQLKNKPYPASLNAVYVNTTIIDEKDTGDTTTRTYTTSNKEAKFSYSDTTGKFTLNYNESEDETINYVIAVYDSYDLGTIQSGATCTLAYGAEVVDEHTFLILPKSNTKYKLTIDNVEYDDSQVKDSRGVIMSRGSGGYAMWAALKNSGWSLGICDVIATGFDTTIDYGCFNVESDMQDVLYNIQYIQELYGGILDWDSENKVLNYRAENDEDYQSYKDNFNKWKGYEFRPGKNMTKLPEVIYDNSLITRAYLLGYGNLNVKKVNAGKTYIDNFSYTADIYEGYLEQPLIYDTNDEGGMKQLLYWGKKELSKKCRPRQTVKIEATDIRTVEGYEHEIFDINDVVKVYYQDDETDVLKSDVQRVISWEYNAFALWDSTIELGDKTQNLSDIFKLIYNKTEQSPKPNASGKVPSTDIVLSGDGYDRIGDGANLSDCIQFIARTTTNNSDAIAGLILKTNTISSSVDLFASYQKQTDNMFTKTYAGLQFYADEKSAQAVISANKETNRQIQFLDGILRDEINNTAATLRTYADEVGSTVEATVAGTYLRKDQFNNTLANQKQTIINWVQTDAGFIASQNERYASASMFASYHQEMERYKNDTGELINRIKIESAANAEAIADAEQAIVNIRSTYAKNDAIPTTAEIKILAKESFSEVTSWTMGGGNGTTIYQDSYGVIKISASQKIVLDCQRVELADIYGSADDMIFDFNGAKVEGFSNGGGIAIFG